MKKKTSKFFQRVSTAKWVGGRGCVLGERGGGLAFKKKFPCGFSRQVNHIIRYKTLAFSHGTIAWKVGNKILCFMVLFSTQYTLFFFFFKLHNKACGILASCPVIEPVSPVVKAWSLNHWTTGSAACCFCFTVWFFGHKVCGILAPQPGMEPTVPTLEGKVSTTGPPGKSLYCIFWSNFYFYRMGFFDERS